MAEKKKIRNQASSSGSNTGESVVVDVGRCWSSCGYCRSGRWSRVSYGARAQSLTVDDYQALLDRGWRRAGCFLYKPEMKSTCCPSYTIRLKATDFVPSKEQLRVYKKMQRFLEGTLDVKNKDLFMDKTSTTESSCSSLPNEARCSATEKSLEGKPQARNEMEGFMHHLSSQIDSAVHAFAQSEDLPCDIQLPKASVRIISPEKRKLLVEGSEVLLFSSNISFQIAAALRRMQKDVNCGKISRCSATMNGQSLELTPQMIAEKLVKSLDQQVEGSSLSIRACNGHINFYSPKNFWLGEAVERDAVSKKSHIGSVSKGTCSNTMSECPQGKRRRLEIRLKRSSFDPDEFALYRRYQMKVHNDTSDRVTESSYKRFLVDTPLIFVPSKGDGTVPQCGFGSFHQQYLIDDKLVAVGVMDILPKCLSSKYLFWDPDLAVLSLGKYSALQEISWVKENQLHCPSLEYYYLGYYIHSCRKMRYKATYSPSELLCPLRYQWVPFSIARPLLDRKPYVVLSDYATLSVGEFSTANVPENHMEVQHAENDQDDMNDVPISEDEEMAEFDFDDCDADSVEEEGSVANILIGLKRSRLRYKDLQLALGSSERRYLENQMRRYVRAVGPELSERMVYSLG